MVTLADKLSLDSQGAHKVWWQDELDEVVDTVCNDHCPKCLALAIDVTRTLFRKAVDVSNPPIGDDEKALVKFANDFTFYWTAQLHEIETAPKMNPKSGLMHTCVRRVPKMRRVSNPTCGKIGTPLDKRYDT